jgi:hypothetical protein
MATLMKTPKDAAKASGSVVSDLAVSVGDARSKPYAGPKTTGIKMRGTGAATKGVMARGPMG